VRSFVIIALVAGCGDNLNDALDYPWDDRNVLCSEPIDDYQQALNWDAIEHRMDLAAEQNWVFIVHAHIPTMTVSLATLERVLTEAENRGLAFFTFRELVPGTPHGGLALAFDDNSPDQWMLARDTLNAHGAHVTFFLARFTEMTPLGHQEISILAGDGHDMEPHTVNHLHAPDYVAQHGIDAYLADEVLPSFQVLVDAGFPAPAAFAYPFGDHTPEIDTAVLQHVGSVRTTPGQCPWSGWH
jgi:hypothetical protein